MLTSRLLRTETIETPKYQRLGDGSYIPTGEVHNEDRSLRLVVNDALIGLTVGSDRLASTEPGDSAHLVKLFARIDAEERPTARVAHLGGGMAWLPKMLLGYGYEQDVYEIDHDIILFLKQGILNNRVNFIEGDWRETLNGSYDFIVYDIDYYPTEEDLRLIKSHLATDGKLIKTF